MAAGSWAKSKTQEEERKKVCREVSRGKVLRAQSNQGRKPMEVVLICVLSPVGAWLSRKKEKDRRAYL